MRSAVILTAVGLSVSALALTAGAQPGPGAPSRDAGAISGPVAERGPGFARQHGPGQERGHRFFERFDTDGDGVVTPEEVEAVREATRAHRDERRAERAERMATRAVERFDANGDGVLDQTELAAMFEAGPRHHQRVHGQRRGAGDDRDGRRGMVPGMGEPGMGRGMGRGMGGPGMERVGPGARLGRLLGDEALAPFDTDGDGVLSREEARASREEIRALLGEKAAELRMRFDLDGDGELSREERRALRATLGAERRVRAVDTDGDGVLDARELARALDLIRRGHKSADFNGDGVVDDSDYDALIKTLPSL